MCVRGWGRVFSVNNKVSAMWLSVKRSLRIRTIWKWLFKDSILFPVVGLGGFESATISTMIADGVIIIFIISSLSSLLLSSSSPSHRGHRFVITLFNNYWMRLSMISWIIKAEVCVICRRRRLRQITQTRGFDNSWYYAKTEFNNCFIIHFSHNSSSETEAKRSAILFLRRTLQVA